MSEEIPVPAVADASAAPDTPPPVAPVENAPTGSGTPFQEESTAGAEAGEPETQPIAPTAQPPLPVGGVFGGTAGQSAGKPSKGFEPKEKTAIYVDDKGEKQEVEVVAERPDGSVDIMLPATIGGIRIDGLRRKTSDDQTGGFIE